MQNIEKFITEKSPVNGFDFYKYLHIKGGSWNKGGAFRYGGEFDFILFYAMPEEMDKKPVGMCERLWCIDKGIEYGEGDTIEAAFEDYKSKIDKQAPPSL